MKYLIPLAALTIGALAQQEFPHPTPNNHIQINSRPIEAPHQQEVEEAYETFDPLTQQPEISADWAAVDNQNPTVPSVDPQMPEPIRERPDEKHHRKDHKRHPRPDQNDGEISEQGWNRGPRDDFNGPMPRPGEEGDQFYNEHQGEESGRFKGCGKFMKGKGIGHIIFFVVLGVLALFLVKKCIKKHKNKRRQMCQMASNSIGEKISEHYAEIQRLTEMKNKLQRHIPAEPIIYHQSFPQEMEMSQQPQGRMINENCYPVNPPQNVQYQQNIPVGRPIYMGNPYNNQAIYRGNQF